MTERDPQAELEKKINPQYRRIGRLEVEPTVFFGSAILILLFVAIGATNAERARDVFGDALSFILTNFGWHFILVANFLLGLAIYFALSPMGRVRLGGADARPHFGVWAWFAMLFSAGMGIGLLFYSVAEPVMHFDSKPLMSAEVEATTGAAVETERNAVAIEDAMAITYFHWGLHAWGIYAIVGAAIAYFSYNRGLPLSIRSSLHPLIGDRIYGAPGSIVDLISVVATLFGVATSLGIGVMQINAGVESVFPSVPYGLATQVGLIVIITGFATVSVVLGLDRGIRRLSELNMALAGVLLVAVFLLGPTVHLLDAFVQNLGGYAERFLQLSFRAEAYGRGDDWQHGWTLFFWAWWIAWSPFVGMFIARISYGRTVREFIVGVLAVPSLLAFLWLSVFGNTALYSELHGGGGIVEAVNENNAVALFELLSRFPLPMLTSILAIFVVTVFFITSSDSGSLVIDTITAGGHPRPPVMQKVFWAVTEGVVAAVLLFAGGLNALQTGSVVTGLPFSLVILVMCYGLFLGLRQEVRGGTEIK